MDFLSYAFKKLYFCNIAYLLKQNTVSVLEVANGDYGDFTDVLEIKGRVNTWRNIRKDEDLTERNIPYKEEEIEDDHSNTGNSPSELYKLCILMKRSIKKMKRDWVRFKLFVAPTLPKKKNFYEMRNIRLIRSLSTQ